LTYAEVKSACGVDISHSTIKRILRANGITAWRAKGRPALTPEVAAKRLAWAKARKDWPLERWSNIIWSDECSAERGKGQSHEWCFGIPSQKYYRAFVQVYKKGGDIKVMVWACFWKEGNMIKRSNLYIMDRDFESKKHGYSARSYIQVLDDNIPSIWQPGLFFMQDNAPIHMANSVRKWFEDIGIPLEDHPPYSPDLNPIEHLWWHLKNKALQLHPELQDLGVGEQALQALERALIEAWEAIPDSIFEACLNSMPKRVQAVIDADGWHTKY